MDILSELNNYESLRIRIDEDIIFVQIYRPQANNTINNTLIDELNSVLDLCDSYAKIVVLEGLPEVFCFGADFQEIKQNFENQYEYQQQSPELLYDLWTKLSSSSYLTVAHVRGKTNAGGIGFVAACDIVLCDEKATFSLSELLFGLMPACVLPFLIRRVGYVKANYMTLMTQPVSSQVAQEWGLVDACEQDSDNLLRKHLLRLRRLTKNSISRYKLYLNKLDNVVFESKKIALEANMEVFSDETNRENIARYVSTGLFPWQEA